MDKFIGNDRRVILKSAATGVVIISVLSLTLLTESVILCGLAFFGVLAVYWNIPTWFSRDRQLEKREIKHFNAEGLKIDKPPILKYQYFNAEGKEVMKPSDSKKMFAFIFMCVISAFLIISGYDTPVKFFLARYPSFKILIIGTATVISLSTPYLMRHIYCFILNLPMDTSFKIDWSSSAINNRIYIHKYDDTYSYNTVTNSRYSSLGYNIYHQRR